MPDTPETPCAPDADEAFLYGYSPIDGGPLYNVQSIGEVMMDPRRFLGRTRLVWKQKRAVEVSTVGLLHLSPKDAAFETMAFGDVHLLPPPMNEVEYGEIGGSYATRNEALTGHRAWCRMIAGWLCFKGRHTVTWQEITVVPQ